MTKIYGIDPDQKLTPLMVRDAMVTCFFEAHCVDTGINQEDEEANREYCREVVQNAFTMANGNFQDPTKEDLLNAISNLAAFSKNFRDPEVIKKHAAEITKLVEKL